MEIVKKLVSSFQRSENNKKKIRLVVMAKGMENLLLGRAPEKFLALIIFCFLTRVIFTQVFKCAKLFLGF